MDINSLISSYVEKNGGDVSSIVEKLKNIANEVYDERSIFSYGEDASEEEFMDYILDAASRSDDAFKNDVELLFNIIDENGDGTLSDDELSMFKRTGDTNHGQVDGFGLWNNLLNANESKVNSSNSSSDETTVLDDDEVPSSGSDAASTSGAGEADDETPVENNGNNNSTSSKNYDLSDPDSAKDFISKFIDEDHKTYEEAISYLVDIGAISEEDAENIRNAITKGSLSSEDQEKVDALLSVNPDMTEEEAIEKLGLNTNNDTSALNEAVYKEVNVEEYADQIYNATKGMVGTDEAALESLLNDETISDEDFVRIVEAYEKKYGQDAGGKGFITMIENETSGDLQSRLTRKVGERLMSAAENGDEKAIDMICKELYSGTAGQNCTANDFLDAIFATENEDVIYNINERYGKVNSGRDLITDLKNDHLGFLGLPGLFGSYGKATDYITKINEAKRHH